MVILTLGKGGVKYESQVCNFGYHKNRFKQSNCSKMEWDAKEIDGSKNVLGIVNYMMEENRAGIGQ